MKTASPALVAHLATGGRAALLVKITRQDGTVIRLTEANRDIAFPSGVWPSTMIPSVVGTYAAAAGFERSNLSADVSTNPGSFEITVPFDSTTPVTPLDVRAGAYDLARTLVVVCNPDDLTMGGMIVPGGMVGTLTPVDHELKIEILGLAEYLNRGIIDSVYPKCGVDFADLHTDNLCKLDPAGFTVTGTVTAVADPTGTFTILNASALAVGHFGEGEITFATGLNTGFKLEVRTAALISGLSFQIQLKFPAPAAIQVGDTYSILAGCDKTLADCQLYSNVINMRAALFVSGLDALVATPDTQ